MSFDLIDSYLREQIKNNKGQKIERNHFTPMLTALSSLVKNELIEKDNISISLSIDLENVINDYRQLLKQQNKSDTRSPLVRVRKLAAKYKELTHFESLNLPFTDIVQEAINRKYEEKLYTGTVTPSTRVKIKKEHVTYRSIAADIIISSKEVDVSIWHEIKIEDLQNSTRGTKINSCIRVLRGYLCGDSVPTERMDKKKLLYIEKFLSLPSEVLLDKVTKIRQSKVLVNKKEKKRIENKKKGMAKKYIPKKLNVHLEKCYQEYRDFKVDDIQPPIRNISELMNNSKYPDLDYRVIETTKRSNANWTKNSHGFIPTADGFYSNLKMFTSFCVTNLKIPEEEVSTAHLA
jgi:hypothetical protein